MNWNKGAALLLVLLALAGPTYAHGYIVRSIPEDRATLERPPTRVQYWFSEDLEPEFSSLTLRDQTGAVITTGGVDEEDRSLMVLRPPATLADGAYVVELRPAFASDGHVVAETRVFFVGEEVGGVTGEAADDTAVPLEVVWRGMVLTAITLLFGLFVTYERVLLPSWGSDQFAAGFLPPRVMQRLNRAAIAALIVALLGNTLALVQQAMVFFNTGIVPVVSSGLWNTARIGSRFGDVWTVRMILLVLIAGLLGLSIYWRDEKPRAIRPFWTAMGWGAALVLGTFAAGSHLSGSLVMPWVGVMTHWLHMVAVAVWVGGLAAITLVLPVALAPYEGDTRRRALVAVLRRFSHFAVGALAITVATGIYNASNWLFEPTDINGTTYGLALVFKTALVLGLVILGALHHIAIRPERYRQFENLFTGHMLSTLRLEIVFAFVVLLSAGLVSATPPPQPDFIQADIPAPTDAQTVNDMTLEMSITPGGPGVNTYDARLLDADGDPLSDAEVFVQFASPQRGLRGIWHTGERIEDGLFVAAGDEIDAAGDWLSLVDVTLPDGSATRFAFEWDITEAATVVQSISPTRANWIALAGVVAAVGYVMIPDYRRFMRRMNLNTFMSSVILGAVALTVIGVGFGFTLIQGVQQQYDQTLNPPPEIVNPVLPDNDSISRGAQLYETQCVDLRRDERVLASLVERLSRTRDDELFAITGAGWRALGPCTETLTDEERWDVVNYFRTMEVR